MEYILIAVAGLLVIAGGTQIAPKIGVASPLILLALGTAVGFLPFIAPIDVPPWIILEVVLPPLLFAAASRMPVLDFLRELVSVAALALGLVVVCTLVLGWGIHALIPAIPLPWALALGAVLSPTDAVAVTIAQGSGVSHRIITILEGEGLFNDASALVLLSAAISVASSTDTHALDPLHVAGEFTLALLIAIVIGVLVGEATTRLRAHVSDPTANVVISFTVPFLASVPAEYLGGSGLVAAVMAGLVVSSHGPRLLSASARVTAARNWHTVELILEGGIFLVMGLQVFGIVHAVHHSDLSLLQAGMVALGALVLTVVLRAVWVSGLLSWLSRRRRLSARRVQRHEDRMRAVDERIAHAAALHSARDQARHSAHPVWEDMLRTWEQRLARHERRHRRLAADLAYFEAEALGPRDGVVLVWAGMRGAVTLAAAQTLPLDAPMRSFLLLVALVVAGASLLVQGFSLPAVISWVRPTMAADTDRSEERQRIMRLMRTNSRHSTINDYRRASALSTQVKRLLVMREQAVAARGSDVVMTEEGRSALLRTLVDDALADIQERRETLLDARDEGIFCSATLKSMLDRLDGEELLLAHIVDEE